MNKPSKYGKSAIPGLAGYVSPERLTTFKLIFEAVCDELAIPRDAIVERELLAIKIMVAGKAVQSEMMLITIAMEAIADHRQKLSTTVAQSMDKTSLEPQAGHEPAADIHAEH
jgi:hypothetical protein